MIAVHSGDLLGAGSQSQLQWGCLPRFTLLLSSWDFAGCVCALWCVCCSWNVLESTTKLHPVCKAKNQILGLLWQLQESTNQISVADVKALGPNLFVPELTLFFFLCCCRIWSVWKPEEVGDHGSVVSRCLRQTWVMKPIQILLNTDFDSIEILNLLNLDARSCSDWLAGVSLGSWHVWSFSTKSQDFCASQSFGEKREWNWIF